MKCLLFFFNFKYRNVSTDFNESPKDKICPVEVPVFCAHGQTDRRNEANSAFRSCLEDAFVNKNNEYSSTIM